VKHLRCAICTTRRLLSPGLEGRPVFAPEAAAEEGAQQNGSRVLAKSTSVAAQGSAFTRTLQVSTHTVLSLPYVCARSDIGYHVLVLDLTHEGKSLHMLVCDIGCRRVRMRAISRPSPPCCAACHPTPSTRSCAACRCTCPMQYLSTQHRRTLLHRMSAHCNILLEVHNRSATRHRDTSCLLQVRL
jgi:hypothetical protein